jgi:hypothetical protein
MIEVGSRIWEKDRGGDGLRGGMVIEVWPASFEYVVVQAHGKDRKGKAVIDVVVLKKENIDFDMIEETGPHERGKLVRSFLLRMGQRNHALRTVDDERDIAVIDALWST